MNMMCIKCSNKAVVSLKHMGSFCSHCFLSTIEKRIRKDLNIHKVFAPHESVLVINDRSLKAKLTMHFLNSISKNIPLKIDIIANCENNGTSLAQFASLAKHSNSGTVVCFAIRNAKPKKKYDKIVTPNNLDDNIAVFLESLFKTGKPIPKCKEVHLLRTVSNEELLLAAKLLKIKAPLKKSKLSNILDALESRYPGSKFGLFNSIAELK